ncbi:MAG: TIGR00341 family protein, partial [Leptospiraceae bacterium]|nr:TIGR00341 family protein [Leptospiraceae bacterium]
KGMNLWTLIFAIFIASIGLNTNSTAVIIGAMLISPLMGPIVGAGLGIGIYDFSLVSKSLRNLSIATIVSILTSYIYFLITPLNEIQSELLSRTNPTIYDVLIAFFGGAAGIVANSRRTKGNAIPGVAIATALMPPLCTAGFGLATGNWKFFFGAFYLFLINCTFICLSTILFVWFLRFKPVSYVDEDTESKVKKYIIIFSLAMIIPSIYMAWNVVRDTIFKQKVLTFVRENVKYKGTKVLNLDYSRHEDPPYIEISLLGDTVKEDTIKTLQIKLNEYGLEKVELRINQAKSADEVLGGKELLNNLYAKNDDLIKNKDQKISILENELKNLKSKEKLLPKVAREISILFPEIDSFSFGDLLVTELTDLNEVKDPTVIIKWKRRPNNAQKKKIVLFLKSRLEIEDLKDISTY